VVDEIGVEKRLIGGTHCFWLFGNYGLEGKALRGKYCYIPDSPQTTLGPEPLLKPICTSRHVMFQAYSDTPWTRTLSGHLVHTLSLLLSHLLYDTHSLTYIFRYPVITDYLHYPLPYPYDTFTWKATQNTYHGDFIYTSIATDISAHFGHLLRVQARYLSNISCHR
jgi:hypothetical protein